MLFYEMQYLKSCFIFDILAFAVVKFQTGSDHLKNDKMVDALITEVCINLQH